MARISRKQLKQDDFVEAAVDASQWLEHNWLVLVKWAVPVVLVALGALGWWAYAKHNRAEAKELLGQGLRDYEQAQANGFSSPEPLNAALGVFEQVVAEAGSAPAGRVARFYQGVSLYRLGRLDEATQALEEASSSSPQDTLAVTARAMLAEVHAAAGRTDKAMALLTELAEAPQPLYPPEEALLKLGWVHTKAGNQDEARKTWQRLLDQYPKSGAAQEVTRLLGPRQTS